MGKREEQEQGRLDFGVEDLPLFSGTPMTVEGPARAADRGPVVQGAPFGDGCRVCYGTGIVQVSQGKRAFCSCAIGQRLREEARCKSDR